MLKTKRANSQAGLSLLEVILAIAIVSISLSALVVIGNASLQATGESRDRAIADQLVRQALEQTRATRDSLGWNALLNIGGSQLAIGSARWYSINSSGALEYRQTANVNVDVCTFASNGNPSPYRVSEAQTFYRVITIQRLNANEVKVVATLCYAYRSNGTHRSDTAQTLLTNWR